MLLAAACLAQAETSGLVEAESCCSVPLSAFDLPLLAAPLVSLFSSSRVPVLMPTLNCREIKKSFFPPSNAAIDTWMAPGSVDEETVWRILEQCMVWRTRLPLVKRSSIKNNMNR